MIITTQELYLKYKDYKAPHIKIQTEVKNERLFLVKKGMYETNRYIEGYYLTNFLVPSSYLSFEYVLSQKGLIPERCYTYTCATTRKNHTKKYDTMFGYFSYQDVPVSVFRFGKDIIVEEPYSYTIASPEKALCDLLYKLQPVNSIKELKRLMFEDLRIDEELFLNLNKDDLLFLCPLYKKKNLNYLMKYLEKIK